MNFKLIEALQNAQKSLETFYKLKSPVCVEDFISTDHKVPNLGSTLFRVLPSNESELEISVLLDRDYFSASNLELSSDQYSIIFEEVSHFFALSIFYSNNLETTKVSLEAQSEIDRLICAHCLPFDVSKKVTNNLREKLFYVPYPCPDHESARQLAIAFLRQLSSTNPQKWRPSDFEKIHKFFRSPLSEKFRLAKRF